MIWIMRDALSKETDALGKVVLLEPLSYSILLHVGSRGNVHFTRLITLFLVIFVTDNIDDKCRGDSKV